MKSSAKKNIADDEVPSDGLKRLARAEAKVMGHSMTHWEAKTNGCWTSRCTSCWRVASVIPAMLTRDGKGRGGKALSEYCVGVA